MQYKVPERQALSVGLQANYEENGEKFYVGRFDFLDHLMGCTEFIGW